jgi:hypothetical protein
VLKVVLRMGGPSLAVTAAGAGAAGGASWAETVLGEKMGVNRLMNMAASMTR